MTIDIRFDCDDIEEALEILERVKDTLRQGQSIETDVFSLTVESDEDDPYARDFLEGKALLGE